MFCSSRLILRSVFDGDLRNCYAPLSRRERQVMALVGPGLWDRQVCGELDIASSLSTGDDRPPLHDARLLQYNRDTASARQAASKFTLLENYRDTLAARRLFRRSTSSRHSNAGCVLPPGPAAS